MYLINEVYYGNNNYLINIENAITKIQKLKKSDKELIPLLTSISQNLCNCFNIKKVEISLYKDPSILCCCYPVYGTFDYDITNTGVQFKYKNKNELKYSEVNLMINTGFFIDPKELYKIKVNFTPREIVAILLHEIGHSFAKSVMPLHNFLNTVYSCLNTIRQEDISEEEKKNIIDSIVSILRHCGKNVLDSIRLVFKTGKIAVMNMFTTVNSVNEERYADSFATVYGYGPELSSALIKLDMIGQKLNKKYKLNIFDQLLILPLQIFVTLLIFLTDPHPNTCSRLKNNINTLEYEVNNNKGLHPKTKKEILIQIKKINTMLKNINDNDYKYNNGFNLYLLKTMKILFPDTFSFLMSNTSEYYSDELFDKNMK